MKGRIKGRYAPPYGGNFNLNLPDKGMVGNGYMFDQLLRDIKGYRKANALPIGVWFEEEVEEEVCKKYPGECDFNNPDMPRYAELHSSDVARGIKIMLKHKLAGSPLVDDATALRRAEICVKCPYNVSIRYPCAGRCGDLEETVRSVIGSKQPPFGDRLKACAICKCFVGVSIYVPLQMQQSVLGTREKEYFKMAGKEVGCWKAEGL